MFRRKPTEASLLQTARRTREDSAQRLLERVSRLLTLRLQIEERKAGSEVVEAMHVRPVVVASAPAMFEIPCGDPSCKQGGHDFTQAILRELSMGQTAFESDDSCNGSLGSANAPCQRTMRVVALATFS